MSLRETSPAGTPPSRFGLAGFTHRRLLASGVAPTGDVNSADYNLTKPSEEQARAAVERVLGPEAGGKAWQAACEAVGLRQPRPPLSRRQLRAVADHLSKERGFVGVIGASLQIRLNTYEALYGVEDALVEPRQSGDLDG